MYAVDALTKDAAEREGVCYTGHSTCLLPYIFSRSLGSRVA